MENVWLRQQTLPQVCFSQEMGAKLTVFSHEMMRARWGGGFPLARGKGMTPEAGPWRSAMGLWVIPERAAWSLAHV